MDVERLLRARQRLTELLVERAHDGVDIRILMPGDKNDVTAARSGSATADAPLLAAGIQLYEFQPAMMHAKAMIVDDRVAVIGSINLDSLSLTRLEEDAVVVEDPALVTALGRDWDDDSAHSHRAR